MKCKFCKTKPVWKFTNQQQLCKSCFAKYFDRKVKNTIRRYNMPIGTIKSTKPNAKIINKITKTLPKRKGKISVDNLDDISVRILYIMMYSSSKELKKLLPKNQPLYFLSNKEILLYAKIKKIKGKIVTDKKIKQINDFIEIIEKKNPDIRHNIVNALLITPYIYK